MPRVTSPLTIHWWLLDQLPVFPRWAIELPGIGENFLALTPSVNSFLGRASLIQPVEEGSSLHRLQPGGYPDVPELADDALDKSEVVAVSYLLHRKQDHHGPTTGAGFLTTTCRVNGRPEARTGTATGNLKIRLILTRTMTLLPSCDRREIPCAAVRGRILPVPTYFAARQADTLGRRHHGEQVCSGRPGKAAIL